MNKPNILLFITDQQRMDTMGFRAKTPCKTPNIDWLASHGVSFNRCLSPCPLCTPARASLFTGLYLHQLKARYPGEIDMLTNNNTIEIEPVFSNLLRNSGNHLSYAGKWHWGDDVISSWFDQCAAYALHGKQFSEWCRENDNDYSQKPH